MLPKTLSLFSSALQRLLARSPARPMFCRRRQHRLYRQHRAELQQMSARELSDLGIGRGEIPALLETPATWREGRR